METFVHAKEVTRNYKLIWTPCLQQAKLQHLNIQTWEWDVGGREIEQESAK